MNIPAINATNYSMNKSKSNVNFGMKIVPETKFLENILNLKRVPSLPSANGGDVIPQTMTKIGDIITKAIKGDLLDKSLEAKGKIIGFDVNSIMPNYKNLEAQLRFKIIDKKLTMTLSSEPFSTNGLPFGVNRSKLAECYAPQNFRQSGTTASVVIDELGPNWARKLPENMQVLEQSLNKLIAQFSDLTFTNAQRRIK